MKKFHGANVIASTVGLPREDWLKLRMAGIGGSEIAGIAGMSRYSSPLKVYLDKTEGSRTEENEAMYWGNELEDVVAREFAKRTGMKCKNVNYVLQHKDNPWMMANLDRTVGKGKDLAILECKTAGHFAAGDWADGKTPEAYQMQVAWYMAVTGIKKAFIAVLIAGQRFEWRELQHDQAVEDHLITLGARFWQLVEDRTAPSMDGSDVADEYLQKKYRDATHTSVELDAGAQFLLDQYNRSKEIIDQQTTVRAMAKQNLEALIGHNEVATNGGKQVITWKEQSANRFDTTRFKADHPQMADAYTNTTSGRVFRVK